jgi:hypothetical protein
LGSLGILLCFPVPECELPIGVTKELMDDDGDVCIPPVGVMEELLDEDDWRMSPRGVKDLS